MGGWSLLEAMMVMGLIAMLSTLGVASWADWRERSLLQQASRQLVSLILWSENMALSKQRIISACLIQGNRCASSGRVVRVFDDRNQNGIWDEGETIWIEKSLVPAQGQITWHGFSKQVALAFQSDLEHAKQNGRFDIQTTKRAKYHINVGLDRVGLPRIWPIEQTANEKE